MSPPKFFVLSIEESKVSDEAFCKFAHFLGIQTEIVVAQNVEMPSAISLIDIVPSNFFLACSSLTLRKVFQEEWFEKLLGTTHFTFVYGFFKSHNDWPELKWLTNGGLTSVSRLGEDGEKRIAVSNDVTYREFPVSGKSFILDSGSFAVFSGEAIKICTETYVSINGQPNLVSVARGNSLVFILACESLVDVDTPLKQYESIRGWYPELIAMSIVLRAAGGSWCWTSPVTPANFIVDDPDLRPHYGFFHYASLIPALVRTGGALTVAFIPYNHRRSDPKTIELVRQNPESFSICVHGCDHTGGEYASKNTDWLTGLTFQARERMDAHSRITGLPYDNVMVIPQGEFSGQGLAALKTCGFDAAVNTTPWPVDAGENRMTLRDRLQIAVTHYENFPVFVRRYPVDVFDYAFDALFQKPILAVEHHGFFRQGNGAFVQAVREISTIKTNLAWMPLGRAIASSCLIKQTGDGEFEVRHFTWALHLKNPTKTDWQLSLHGPTHGESIRSVLVDGHDVSFEIESDQLKYACHLPAGRQLNVRIVPRHHPVLAWRPAIRYRLSTWVRRKLSDIRDNQIARSERLLALAERLKDVLPR